VILNVHTSGSPEVERLVADDAGIRLDAGVAQREVKQQLVGRGESEAAFVADVRPRLQVDVLVLVKSLRLRELASAVFTLEWLLAGVMAHVRGVLRRKQERLWAEGAWIRALIGVDALVSVEIVDARELFSTNITGIRSISSMSTHMEVQVAHLQCCTHYIDLLLQL